MEAPQLETRSQLLRAEGTFGTGPNELRRPMAVWVDDARDAVREALAEFTRFFLETCLDQVRFMESLVQPDRLRDRILLSRD